MFVWRRGGLAHLLLGVALHELRKLLFRFLHLHLVRSRHGRLLEENLVKFEQILKDSDLFARPTERLQRRNLTDLK